jgi:hypothetical protein
VIPIASRFSLDPNLASSDNAKDTIDLKILRDEEEWDEKWLESLRQIPLFGDPLSP